MAYSHHLAAGENEALEYVRQPITFLPQNNLEDPPVFEEESSSPTDEELAVLGADIIAGRRGFPEPHAPYTGTVAGG